MSIDLRKINGVTLAQDEPYPYLDQAYALASLAADGCDDEDRGPPNHEILGAAFRGIATLIHLASIGLASMDEKREARRG